MGTNTQRWNFHIHGPTFNFPLGVIHCNKIYLQSFLHQVKVKKRNYAKNTGKKSSQITAPHLRLILHNKDLRLITTTQFKEHCFPTESHKFKPERERNKKNFKALDTFYKPEIDRTSPKADLAATAKFVKGRRKQKYWRWISWMRLRKAQRPGK